MKHLLEMNHFLPTLKTGNAKKSNVQFDSIEIPENIKKFFSRHGRNLNMISEIHEDGTIDIYGKIMIQYDDLVNGKLPIKFGYVSGDFYYNNGNNLTSLEGCPKEVGGNFGCGHNQLKSLKGCPQKIGGDFYCNNNQLTSLKGCPQEVGRDLCCSGNELTSLEGCTQKIGGNFHCDNNKLTSLDGCPQKVRKNFNCYNNFLKSLKGGPQKVGGYFNCSNNRLISLEGCPQKIGGVFDCSHNPGNFTGDDVRQLCNVKRGIFI